ncbi:MAG: cation-translocating P-type ATPase [Pirellulaceae bacterium]
MSVPSPSPLAAEATPHALTADALATELKTSLTGGLNDAEVSSRQQQFGPNELREAPPLPMWRRFLGQFQDLVIWILIVAAVISGVMGDITDTVAILAIVLLNGLIGFFQQERAEQAIAALKKMTSPSAKVIRDGKSAAIPVSQLVPGDLIDLEAGDYIPADSRLSEAASLQVQEASLTGESTAVEKNAGQTMPEQTPLADRANMIYMGTVATTGRGKAIVVATGMQTELGRIAGMLEREPPEATPLQRRLAELGRVLVWVCLVLVAIVFALEMARGGEWLKTFLVAVSLAVAAVPEGLPAVVTLALALGLQRMAKRNALVRRLPSVETLGSVTVICSDKTGTLTRNEMTVRTILAGQVEYRTTGTGYGPDGQFFRHDASSPHGEEQGTPVDVAQLPDLRALLTAAARCNNAKVVPAKDQENSWQVLGDPTEGALIVAARKGGIDEAPAGSKRVSEIPFDSQRKQMSVIFQEADGAVVMYAKGAPEVLLPLCRQELVGGETRPLGDKRRQQIFDQCAGLASAALRVLALAMRPDPEKNDDQFTERDFVLTGVCGMIDPPREEAKEAVASARSAGISPVMITGDHPATAGAIARELGILADNGLVVTGQELQAMSDEQFAERVADIRVYARVSAEDKLRVVHAWKKRGAIVAMTGDGVNDAPAVKAADIGIAMGISGTDVTKEASDMVLTDDNFKSIIGAVEEGRCIFDNIRNVARFLLSCNAGEVLFMMLAALVGWPLPLAAIQILWINLVTDGLPALALAMEPPEKDIMKRPPRPPREPVLTLEQGTIIFINGLLIAATTALGFWLVYRGNAADLPQARTVAFCILAYSQLCFSFACRSSSHTLPELGLFSNPYLLAAITISALLQLGVVAIPWVRPIFETLPISVNNWLLVLVLALVPVTLVEIAKIAVAAARAWKGKPVA